MMIIDEHLLLAFYESPEYIPQEQLLYGFVGTYRGEPLFIKLQPKPVSVCTCRHCVDDKPKKKKKVKK